MAGKTGIEWTDATWNPVRGCSRVSEGCRNCYAEVMAARFSGPGQWGEGLATMVKGSDGLTDHRWTGKVEAAPDHVLTQPLRWRKPRRIFVNSTSDLFHEGLPDKVIDWVFAVMALCPQHIFQVLTKRPERMRRYMEGRPDQTRRSIIVGCTFGMSQAMGARYTDEQCRIRNERWPLPNVWLGTSVEDQASADARIPHLLAAPAAIRFVSAEPLLGPVRLDKISETEGDPSNGTISGWYLDALAADAWDDVNGSLTGEYRDAFGRARLDWVIVGGESGPGARPMHPEWARSLRDQCATANVPFFFKQWGAWVPWEFRAPPDMTSQAGGWMDANTLPDVDCEPGWREDWATDDFEGHCVFERVGKGAAGRLLDGRTHDAMPEGA